MTLVDTNVIIDITDRDETWFDWSASQLAIASSEGAFVNAIVVAELSRNYTTYGELEGELQELGVAIVPLDEASAFTAGKRYQAFRQSRKPDENVRILPDFLIGAQALTLDVPLLTRDPRPYRRFFPELTLITPGT